LLVLSSARIEVESGGIRHIAPRIVGNDGNVITYLALVGPTFERIKGIAHRHIGRPANAAIGAEGIE
jgi:hypothetical protein